jgi:hypothetical protein
LIEINIKVMDSGSHPLKLDAILASPDGTALKIEIHDGSVTAGNNGTDQPTLASTSILPSSTANKNLLTPFSTTTDENTTILNPAVTHTPQSTKKNFPSATVEEISTLPPSSLPIQDDSTATPSGQAIPLSLPASSLTDNLQARTPTYTPEVLLSPISARSTEDAIASLISTQSNGEEIEQNKQFEIIPKMRDKIFIVVSITILVIGFIVGGIYLNHNG